MLNRILLSAALVVLLPAAAHAGETASAEVDVDLVQRRASGDLVTARYETNAAVKIQCAVNVFAAGAKSAACLAVDAAGDSVTTNNTANADIIAAINGISDHSFISFSWDAQNNLIRASVIKSSIFTPAGMTPNP